MAHFLDITRDGCPMTFVKAKLAMEALAPGETLIIRLNAGEPLENVPRSLREDGYAVTEAEREGEGPVFRIRVDKPMP